MALELTCESHFAREMMSLLKWIKVKSLYFLLHLCVSILRMHSRSVGHQIQNLPISSGDRFVKFNARQIFPLYSSSQNGNHGVVIFMDASVSC